MLTFDQQDEGDCTPLIVATEHDQPEVTKYLLDKGANINSQNIYGTSPLLGAVKVNNLNIVRLLIERGANINGKDMHGQTLLLHALGNAWLEGAEILVENGARIDKATVNSWTPFLQSIRDGLLLIENGASMTIRNDVRNTPLESAIDKKAIEIMKTICLFEHLK